MSAQPRPRIAPLQAGDRLSVAEFERRYEAMPHVKKAELIDGVVYMPSPVSQREHSGPHFRLNCWVGYYEELTPGVEGGNNATVRLKLGLNVPQPDIFLRVVPECGGQSRTSDDGYVLGAPELVAEVTASTASYDLHDKLDAYRRNGVREYLVWRVGDRTIDWFVLRSGKYQRLRPASDGCLKSSVFPGLWLDPQALLARTAPLFAALQRGMATAAYARFVVRLQKARGNGDA